MPILDERHFEFFSYSADQTRRLGIHLGGYLKPGDAVGLVGKLGAGKTTLVQGLAQGWGALDPVSSPTYVIVNEYRRADGQHLYHIDAYRLNNVFDAEILDFDRMLSQGPLVIEWADRIRSVIPEDCLWINMESTGMERRSMMLNPEGVRFLNIVSQLRRKLYGAF